MVATGVRVLAEVGGGRKLAGTGGNSGWPCRETEGRERKEGRWVWSFDCKFLTYRTLG